MKLSPETALLKKNGGFEEVPVEQVRVGDIFAVKSGARLPLDGEVVSAEKLNR
jgi:cation transport ATPase